MAIPLNMFTRGVAANILPEEFDADMVRTFFSGKGNPIGGRAEPDPAVGAFTALLDANDVAKTDLSNHASPFDSDGFSEFISLAPETNDNDSTEPSIFDSADAKPIGKGGGKPDHDNGGGGKGWGKKHESQPEEPVAEEPVVEEPVAEEPVAEEPVAEEPGQEDPVTEEPVVEEPTHPTGEVNPGVTTENSYISGMDNPEGYNLELVFHGDWTDEMKAGFINAAEDISDIITHDVASYGEIDDCRLNLYSEDIDGQGGTLANAGWMQLRDDPDKLVAEGGVRVDNADVQWMSDSDLFEDMAFHEMLHAMGFGTTWRYTGLTEESADGTRFVGENATEAYLMTEAADSDPLASEGVPLSGDDAHWSQSSLGSDLMSPLLNHDNNVHSDMTIAALEDMGYETVYGDDDDFLFA